MINMECFGAPPLVVITVSSDPLPAQDVFMRTAAMHGYPLRFGYLNRSNNFVSERLHMQHALLRATCNTTVVMVVDCFDVFFAQPASLALSRFLASGSDVVWSVERFYSNQDPSDKPFYDAARMVNGSDGKPRGGAYGYLNSGGFMGYAGTLARIVAEALTVQPGAPGWRNRVCGESRGRNCADMWMYGHMVARTWNAFNASLDYDRTIFYVATGFDWSLSLAKQRIAETTPCVVHMPFQQVGGQRRHQPIYSLDQHQPTHSLVLITPSAAARPLPLPRPAPPPRAPAPHDTYHVRNAHPSRLVWQAPKVKVTFQALVDETIDGRPWPESNFTYCRHELLKSCREAGFALFDVTAELRALPKGGRNFSAAALGHVICRRSVDMPITSPPPPAAATHEARGSDLKWLPRAHQPILRASRPLEIPVFDERYANSRERRSWGARRAELCAKAWDVLRSAPLHVERGHDWLSAKRHAAFWTHFPRCFEVSLGHGTPSTKVSC